MDNKTNSENSANRNLWVDYLRSALTVLVVAHHASMAYATFAKFDKVAYIRSTHAIVDDRRWVGADVFLNFNDAFFMSLMFLIGGLFLCRSIDKKGALRFVQDRFYRLLLPFLLGGTFFMLLAYLPSWYVAKGNWDIGAYIHDFFFVERWPVGPPWFLWVLFVFNGLFVFLYPLIRRTKTGTAAFLSRLQNKPLLVWSLFFLLTGVCYLPLAHAVGSGTWTGFGPFDFQISRTFLYLGYFLLGALIGNTDFNHELFAPASALVRKWGMWIALMFGVFILLMWSIQSGAVRELPQQKTLNRAIGWMLYYGLYLGFCTFACLAFLTVFRKWVGRPIAWLDSLSENAYLIYLTHFVFVNWMQFLLLPVNIPAFLKFITVFLTALILSWMTAILLRKIKPFRTYL